MEEEISKVNDERGLSNKDITKKKLPDQVLSIKQLLRYGNGTTKDLKHYLKMLSDCATKRRKIEAVNSSFCIELKDKIERTMDLKPNVMIISEILSQILSDAVKFDVDKHFPLIELLIEAIKVLADSETSIFYKIPAATVLIEVFVDFLYRLKDRNPYSTFVFFNLRSSKIKENMDVFYTIMEFLIPNGYLPCAALLKEYSESIITKELNTLLERELINSKFSEDYQMSKERYEKM